MKKISINGRFLARRMTGVDRFAGEVLRAMSSVLPESVRMARLSLVVPQGVEQQAGQFGVPVLSVGQGAGQAWEQVEFARAQPDALALSLCNTAPLWRRRQVVVIHDAATVSIPQAFSRPFRWWYRVLMPVLGRVSRRVLTVSEFSAQELVRCFGIPRDKITVVSEGGEHILRVQPDATALPRMGLDGRPYILAVSSMAAHKNFRLVLEALAKLKNPPFDVAIAGGANAKVFGDNALAGSTAVKWLGYVSDEELRALYEGAMGFVFPSLYEGFGIPPLEAMNCGCPVLASRAASIPEVCGEAALYFDPRDAQALADLMMRLAGDAELRAQLSRQGRARAAEFSWGKAAQQVLQACDEAARP
jgi:glycosyltransferase involved in cell wall biosynthesis